MLQQQQESGNPWMAPDDPGAAHAAPELAALLAAREDELRAVEASAAARTLDTKVRAKQFFDDVVEKMRACLLYTSPSPRD